MFCGKNDIIPFENKIWLASPTMHGLEQKYIGEAFQKNWITTGGDNIKAIESEVAEFLGCKYAVALSCGTAALHLAVKLAGEEIYGQPAVGYGTLEGRKVITV